MIDGWFSVLVISLIVALGGLAALLIQSYRGDASAAWRELLEGVKWQCGMAPNPGKRLRIRALDDGAICRLGKIFKQSSSLTEFARRGSAAHGERAHSLWTSEDETG